MSLVGLFLLSVIVQAFYLITGQPPPPPPPRHAICGQNIIKNPQARTACEPVLFGGPHKAVVLDAIDACLKAIKENNIEGCEFRVRHWETVKELAVNREKCANIVEKDPKLMRLCSSVVESFYNRSVYNTIESKVIIDCGQAANQSNIKECSELVSLANREQLYVDYYEGCLTAVKADPEVAKSCESVVSDILKNHKIGRHAFDVIRCTRKVEEKQIMPCDRLVRISNLARILHDSVSTCWWSVIDDDEKDKQCSDVYKAWVFVDKDKYVSLLKERKVCTDLSQDERFKRCKRRHLMRASRIVLQLEH